MIQGSRQLPIQHLTIRVPWHDSGWKGTICQQCCANTCCTILPRIATGRDDEFETEHAGKSIEQLQRAQHPPCVDEHGTFMASFPVSMLKTHPYAKSAQITHGHFADTPYTFPPYSAAAVPFRWMLRQHVEGNQWVGLGIKDTLRIDYRVEREPDLTTNKTSGTNDKKWDNKTWVQEGTNQRVILDSFFSATKPNESLVFFYAKSTPLAEDPRRVIIGVGRVKSISTPIEYYYVDGKKSKDKISGYLWERNVEHSIRPNDGDGFLLPYQALLDVAEKDESIDLLACLAFAPNEYFTSYSYATEHLAHDGAIASLLAIEKAVKAMRQYLPDVPWTDYLAWLDSELNRIWKSRGAYPGLGSALNAFGFSHGNLLAWYLACQADSQSDPWLALNVVLSQQDGLPEYLQEGIGKTLREKWERLPFERRSLLMLLARFNLSDPQALRWYQPTEREKADIHLTDATILANPYLVYEDDRLQVDPIAFEIVDRGLFPPESIRKDFPLLEPSRICEAIDKRRVRAIMMLTLEEAAHNEGHTNLMAGWVIQRVRERALQPECPLDMDTLAIMNDLSPKIKTIPVNNGLTAFQLDRYADTSSLIQTIISKRKKAKFITGDYNWAELVDNAISSTTRQSNSHLIQTPSQRDLDARKEKSAALEVLFKAKISVLIGAAGTGKSTLLKALCSIDSVRDEGILLLAPTGKARVRAEQTTGLKGQGKTVAQFLNGLNRYNGQTGRYFINKGAFKSAAHRTIIIDECSMLTEEQLAALFDAVDNVQRFVLVGDPKQLPPIGAGRPYVDIVNFLKQEPVDNIWPHVNGCYAELSITMRQYSRDDKIREDILLADMFSGRPLDAGADEIWHTVVNGKSEFVKLVSWNKQEQVLPLLLTELKSELYFNSIDDEVAFEVSLGGVFSEDYSTVFFNTEYNGYSGASRKAESWQILSPIKQYQAGVTALNRSLQQHFRKNFLKMASNTGANKTIPSPAGTEGIIYGDKVINVVNSSKRETYPKKDDTYVANGDIGIVTGHRRTKKKNWYPYEVDVELTSQPGISYKYKPWEFDAQESTPPLELAYALTVHKTQGSEFGITFVILPHPCRNLSREMLYTALTRQKDKLIILHQGDFKELMFYSHETASEVNRRMTTLFKPSFPIEVTTRSKPVFLDENLIYLTENGELVRSKSEWIIADKLKAAGIKYQYEQPLILNGVERFPDFTIKDDDAGTVYYWEHNGMLSDQGYKNRWQRKLDDYIKAQILPLSMQTEDKEVAGTLLVTEERTGSSLALDDIVANINIILGRN